MHRSLSQRAIAWSLVAVAVLAAAPYRLLAEKLSFDERVEITRGLMAEFANSKVTLPRSKKALKYPSDGKYDREAWQKALLEYGPAARVGDRIQITGVRIEDKSILLEINGGLKSGRHWYDHVQVGMGGTMGPVNRGDTSQPSAGSNIAVIFPKGVPSLNSAEIKAMLAPLFDFSNHSASQHYLETLPEPVKKAIKEQRAVQGMSREQVMLAMGHPRNKSRETHDGEEFEDWVYGEPPGKVTFVTFSDGKVVKIKEDYANIGGSTAPPLPPN